MTPTGIVLLDFHPERNVICKGKALNDGLSVVLQIGDTLWVANDETASLERLSLGRDPDQPNLVHARHHYQFALQDYLHLPAPQEAGATETPEVDIEGVAQADGYLWLTGSHSLKRKQPRKKDRDDAEKQQTRLATVSADGNRYLLARIPLVRNDDQYSLVRETTEKGTHRHAAQLAGNDKGNELTQALQDDAHFAPFFGIPGKDNGFDIEGLAVVGPRIFLGLRGPVLRGWATILEIEPEEDATHPGILKLKPIGPDGQLYLKHFVQLDGLGIRDLCVQGKDFLILAGPTMDLDGPTIVFRWLGGTKAKKESVVPRDELERVMDLPFGEGVDHAEGISLFSMDGGEAESLLVVYDAASVTRQPGKDLMAADVFPLPQKGKPK